MNGPQEFGIAATPTHAPWYWKVKQRGLDERRNEGTGFHASNIFAAEQSLALAAINGLELFCADFIFVYKSLPSSREISLIVVSNRNGRPCPFSYIVGLGERQISDENGKAAGARVSRYSPVIDLHPVKALPRPAAKASMRALRALGGSSSVPISTRKSADLAMAMRCRSRLR